MQTRLDKQFRDTPLGQEADSILRQCVHCGFCIATCPTYQLLGDELDSPRGRIYLIKQMLEGTEATARTRGHLDRCLTCLACETTCPSGVQYHRLIDIGRDISLQQAPRPWTQKLQRAMLRRILGQQKLFGLLFRTACLFRPILPASLRARIHPPPPTGRIPRSTHTRRMLLLDGCVQAALSPRINASSRRVLDRLGITLETVSQVSCCGALDHHTDAPVSALAIVKRNIDAWWPMIERGAEAIVINASGCGAMIKQYGELLSQDRLYADKAARVSALCKDISEVISNENLAGLGNGNARRIAFHSPCTLQHAQKLNGVVEKLLHKCGFQLTPIHDAHLCCGSAGSYSLLQTRIATSLRDNKLDNLLADTPELIATANIGCLHHLQSGSPVPVCHWIELLDPEISD